MIIFLLLLTLNNGYRFISKDVYKTVCEVFDKGDQETINFGDTIIDVNPQEDLKEYLFKGRCSKYSKRLYE